MTTVIEDGRQDEAANEQPNLSTSPKSCLKRKKDEYDSFSNRNKRHNSYEAVKVNENGLWSSSPSIECAKRKCFGESDIHGVLDLTVHAMDGTKKSGTCTLRNLSGNTYFTESDQEGMYVKSPLSSPSPESSASSTSICTVLPSVNGCEQLETTSTICFQPPLFPTLPNRIPNVCTSVPMGFDNQHFPAGFNATDFSNIVQHHLRMNSSNAAVPLCLLGVNASNELACQRSRIRAYSHLAVVQPVYFRPHVSLPHLVVCCRPEFRPIDPPAQPPSRLSQRPHTDALACTTSARCDTRPFRRRILNESVSGLSRRFPLTDR
ncbi:hypothetical protein AHF37_00157 [Paragonimus kellicotti]|nr:hypothetical protein AHF37_00157 [Paragonimus kellicotti]